MSLDVNKIRNDFPILNKKISEKKIIYLDSAATSLTPIEVTNEILEYYNSFNANIHRSTGGLANEATKRFEDSRKKIANFINAQAEEIIFTKNCTESLNLVSKLLSSDLKEGDEIILSMAEHNSNLLEWQDLVRKKNLQLKFIPLKKNGELDIDYAKTLFTERTKILAISQISNVLGILNPIKELTSLAHEVGAMVVVDGAQSVGHINVDVKDLNVDFLAFSAHKLLGPTGVGVLFGKKEILKNLDPINFGGGMVSLSNESFWAEIPWRFEAGTPNISGVIAFGKAIDYFSRKGIGNVENYLKDLTSYALKKLSEIKNIIFLGPSDKLGLISFYIKGISTTDLSLLLTNKGFQLRSGTHCSKKLFDELKI